MSAMVGLRRAVPYGGRDDSGDHAQARLDLAPRVALGGLLHLPRTSPCACVGNRRAAVLIEFGALPP
jgi:hypothetical protein